MIEVKAKGKGSTIRMEGDVADLVLEAAVIVRHFRDVFQADGGIELFDHILRDDDSPLYDDDLTEDPVVTVNNTTDPVEALKKIQQLMDELEEGE